MRSKTSIEAYVIPNLLKEAKDAYIAQKQIVKFNYPQEQWVNFVVSDKK